MKSTNLLAAVGVVAWLCVSSELLADPSAQKFEMAYQWGRDQFEKETAEIENTYVAEVRAAQSKRAEHIKAARVRYLQGLKFLNGNAALPQELRVKVNEDMKRVAELPEPTAPKVEGPAPVEVQELPRRKIELRLNTPDSGWSVRIVQVKRVNNELWILSALQHGDDLAQFVITPVHDSVVVEAPLELPVRHFVLNKTWDWANKENVKFIRGVPDLGRDWALAPIVPVRRE